MQLLLRTLSWIALCSAFCGYTFADTSPASIAGTYSGYIISSIQPGLRLVGTNTLNPDGTFDYEGENGIKIKGRLDFSNPQEIVGTGTSALPKLFGLLQLRYPDGTTGTPVTLRGRVVRGALHGSFASRFEQGLFRFSPVNGQTSPQGDETDHLGLFLLPPDDLPYPNGPADRPGVLVIPGDFTADEAFKADVSASIVADIAESEFRRAGFFSLERSSFGDALASLTRGYAQVTVDPAISRLFDIGSARNVRWIVRFDLVSASNVATPALLTESKRVSTDANKDLDKFAGILTAVAELSDKRAIDLWELKLRFRVLDRTNAKVVQEGQVEDLLLSTQTTANTLGAYTVLQRDVSFQSMARRIVQLAVSRLATQSPSQ